MEETKSQHLKDGLTFEYRGERWRESKSYCCREDVQSCR
jgi:hypothetical protein